MSDHLAVQLPVLDVGDDVGDGFANVDGSRINDQRETM